MCNSSLSNKKQAPSARQRRWGSTTAHGGSSHTRLRICGWIALLLEPLTNLVLHDCADAEDQDDAEYQSQGALLSFQVLQTPWRLERSCHTKECTTANACPGSTLRGKKT